MRQVDPVKAIKCKGMKLPKKSRPTEFQIEIGKMLAMGLNESQIAAKYKQSIYCIKMQKFYGFYNTNSRTAAQYVYKLAKAKLI